MASYRDHNSKHYHSQLYKYPKYVPRHHRYWYENENYKSRRVHQQHYHRRSNDVRGKYDFNMVQTTRAHWKPTQRPASPPIAIPIIEKPVGSNWKLIADPFFGQGPNKIYRFDGIVPNNLSYSEVIVKDPRTFQYMNKVTNLPIVLPVPIYKIDNYSTGQRPEVEVTFSNLDDNIDSTFLSNLVVKYGKVELVQIYYHPISKKHLNLAKIIFDDPVAAKSCVLSLNKTSIMGKVVNVFLDPFASQCKILYNNIIKKSKPVPEVHKIKLLSAKFNEEPIVKPQTKEKLYPSTIQNCINCDCDHITSLTSSVFSSIKSNNVGYNSIGGNPRYSDTHSYTYNRYSCNIPSVPHNHWEVTSPVNPLPLTPELPTEPNVDSAQSKLNSNSKIEVFLNEKYTSVEPTFLSIVKEEPDDTLDCKDNIVDENLNLKMSLQPLVNVSQSDLAVKEITNDEEMLHLISNSKSPFPYKDIYFKCVNAAIKKENEILKVESLLNIDSHTMHESPDRGISISDENVLGKSPERNNPVDAMRSSSLPSHDEKIIENDTIISQCTKLPNYPTYGYYHSQFNNHYSYQYFPFSLSHPCGPPLLSANYCESKPSYDKCEDENLPAELRKKLMTTVINELRNLIKSDLMKKMGTSIAFKIFNQWWEKVERQLKSTSVTKEESKSEQPALNLNSILEGETEDSETLTVNGFSLGFRATIPKMPFFRDKKKESSPKKTSEQLNKESDQEEMVSFSENETKSINDDEVTKLTFAEQKREGKELFYSDSSTSTSDSSHNSSDVEGSSCDSSENDDSHNDFKWKNKVGKLYKSMTLEDLNKIKDLTPAINDELIKNKCDGKTMKRKIDDDLNNPVEFKKLSVNREKISIKENSSLGFSNIICCLSQQVSDKETKMDAAEKYFKSQFILNKQKIPKLLTTKLKRPLAARDSNENENIVQINLQKQNGSKVKTKYFNRRDMVQEATVRNEFLTKGIDVEDINYLKQSYESLLSNDTVHYHWLNETPWISHPDVSNEIPDKKKKDEWKIHDTGCARTEGYYKVDSKQKTNFKYHFGHTALQINLTKEFKRIKESTGKILALSRKARSHQRRLLTAFRNTSYSDLLKFNALKLCKKRLSFGKSAIHDWGLFAMENIAADEMVIEYVGQIIRPIVADLRERQYEASGIGSSYLFRIDLETIVDATKCGNLSRFINHSCNPNCYAKVVQIEGRKKIVIYSKQPIFVNEEITYDYKFPLEENKIPCLCGANGCRGTLN